ncbi:unnamed protein product [Closterium sp. NIES-64]|nr:unnamed protein product [Closterium sp. NIES-64]
MARVFLASQQFGVGVTCGTEVVVRGVRRALADHPDWVVLQLDVANAFNSFHRDRMFQALQASPEFQCLIPFIGLFYWTPSDLHYRSGTGVVTMHSERGTRQGDPLSPFLYALTQRLALEPVLAEGDVQLWSYADDTYVLGPPDRVLHHFAEISFASGEPEQIDRALQTALEGLPPDVLSLLPPWPSCASASPDSLFAGASRLLEAHALEAVRARHTSPLHLARLTSLQGGGAGAWLTSVPYADPLRIPEALWQAASSSRLGLPIPQLALAGQCSCGQAIDDMTVPHHAVRCPRYGVATTIHDTVKYMLRDFAVEAGFAVKVEDSNAVHNSWRRLERDYWDSQWWERGHGLRDRGSGEARRDSRVAGDSGDGTSCGAAAGEPVEAAGPGRRASRFGLGGGAGREQQRADGGTGGAAGLGGEGQGVREAAGDGAGGSGGLGEGREGEGRGQVDGGEERGRETIGEGAPRDQTGQQPAQQQGPVGRTGRVGTASRIPDLTCRDVGQGLMVLVDVSIADPQREGNVQLRRATPTQIGVAAARRVQEKLRHWGPHLEGLQPAPHFYACVAETFGLLSEPLRQFLGLCAKRIAQRRRDRGGGDDGSARIFEAGLTTRLSVALQRAQAQCMIQHAVRQLGSHTPCPLMPSAPPAPTLRVPAPLPPLLTLPAPPRRFPPPAIRSSPPVRSPPLPSPPPSPPLLHASSFPSPTHSTPCPSSIRTLPLVSRPPMLGFSPPCPSPPFPAPHLPPLPAPPTLPPPCPWLPTSLPHLSPLRVLSFSPPCPSLLPALPLIFRPPPPTPGFSPPRASLSFSVPLLCSLPAPACPCPCLWLLPSLPHPLPVAAPPLAPSTPLPPVHPKSHPTAPTLPRLPVSALHPRDRVRLPTAQRCHTPCPLMPSAPPAPTLRVPAPLPPLLTLPAPPRRFPPPAIRSSPPVRSPPLPSPPPSPPLLHASSFPSPTHSTPCPSSIRTLPLVSRPPMLGFSPPCPSPPFPAPHLPPLPAPPTLPPPCPWLPTSLPHLSPLRVLSFSPPCPSLLPALPLIFRPPPPTPGFSPPRASLSFSVPLLCSLPAPACPCPCLWLLPSLPHVSSLPAPPPARCCPSPCPLNSPAPVHPKSHPTAPTLPRLPVSALHPRDRSHPLPPHAIRSPRPYPPRARSLAASFDPPCPPRRFPPPAIRSSPPVRSPPLPSPPPSPPLLHASSFPSPTHSTPCPSSIRTLPLVSRPPMLGFSPPCPSPPFPAPHLPPLPAPTHSPPPLVLGFLPPCLTFPPSVCSASPLPAPPSSPPCPSFSAPPPPHARFLPSPRLPFFLRASPLLPPCPRLPMPLSLASPLPAPRFFPPCPPSAPPLFSPHPLLLSSLPLISHTPALVSYHPCPSPIQPPPPSPGCPFPLSTPATVCGFQPPNGGAHGAFLRMGKPPRGPPPRWPPVSLPLVPPRSARASPLPTSYHLPLLPPPRLLPIITRMFPHSPVHNVPPPPFLLSPLPLCPPHLYEPYFPLQPPFPPQLLPHPAWAAPLHPALPGPSVTQLPPPGTTPPFPPPSNLYTPCPCSLRNPATYPSLPLPLPNSTPPFLPPAKVYTPCFCSLGCAVPNLPPPFRGTRPPLPPPANFCTPCSCPLCPPTPYLNPPQSPPSPTPSIFPPPWGSPIRSYHPSSIPQFPLSPVSRPRILSCIYHSTSFRCPLCPPTFSPPASQPSHYPLPGSRQLDYPLPFAPSSLFPTLPFPPGSTCPPPPPVEFCPALPTSGPPPVPTPCSPTATPPPPPHLHYSPPTLPLSIGPQPAPPLGPNPLQLSGPLYPLFHPLRTAFPTLFPFPQANPPHPGLCQGVPSPFDALLSQPQQLTPPPPGMLPLGELAADTAREGVSEFVCEGAAEATEDGAAKAAREGAMGVVGEGAAEAAEERAAEAAREGAAAAARERAAGAAREGAAGTVTLARQRAEAMETGFAGVGATEPAAVSAGGTAAEEAIGTAPGEAAQTTAGVAAGITTGEAAGGTMAGEAAGSAVGEAAIGAAGEAVGGAAGEAAESAAGEAAGSAASEAAGSAAGEAAGSAAGGTAGATAGEAAADAAGEAARAASCKVGQTLAGEAAQSTAGEVAWTATGEAAGTAAGEAAGTTADEAAGGTMAGEAAGSAAGEAEIAAAGEAAEAAACEVEQILAGEAAQTAAGEAAGTAAGEAAGTAAREAAGTAAREATGIAAGEAEQITVGEVLQTAAVEAARTAAGATEATAGAGIGGGATGAAGKGVTGTGARESAAPAVAREGTAGASKAEGEAAAEAAGRAIARPVGAAGAAANSGKHTAGPAGPAETAKGASSKAAAGGVGLGDIGATGEGEGRVVPTGVGTEEGDVIAIEEDEGEDVMHIDGPLAQYLTLDGEADPAPLQPHVEVPPLPPMPVPMLAEGPMEGLGETLRTEPREGAPILTSRPPAHPPPGAPLPHPHPQVPVVSRGAAKALAFLAEPCSPTPTLLHGQPPSPSPTPDPTVAGGPPGEHAAETHPQGLAPQAHGSGGTRARTTRLAAGGRTGAEEAEGPTSTARPPNLHSRPAPAPPQGHGSGPAHSPPFCPSRAVSPSQVAAAAIATGRGAVGLRDAPMADATDSPSHPSHPFHVDDPLPQPMVIGEGQGGLLGQGPHPSSAQPARPTPPSTLPALLLSPTGRQVFETPEEPGASLPTPMETDRGLRPCHSHLDGVAPPPVQPVAQEVTSSRDEASAPTETPPPGVAEPSLEPHPAEGQEHTTAHTSGSPPRPPSPASTPVPARGPALSCATPPLSSLTPPPRGAGESSPPLIPGDPVGAQAAHGVPSTASSDATAPIDPADTATSPDQVVSCPTCRSSLANRRALQHHIPFCHPADAARRAQAAHDTASIIPSLSQPRATGMQFTDAQWQTLDSVDWTEYFSPERIHTRPLRRVPERVRGGYLDVLSAILVRIAQDPEAAGPTFLLAAAPTLFLVPATPPDRSHTAAIATRISRFGRGEWAELVSDALGRRTPLPRRTGHRSRTATDPSAADERRIARCLRLAACNETSRACAALESAEAAPDTQGTIQRLQSKHPNAERPTPAWLSGFQGSPLVLSVDHLRRAIFTAPRGSSGGPSGWVAEHLRDTFLAFPQSLHFLLAVYQQWLRGRCAPAARSLLASSTLVALAKSNMDVRPIAIGEVLVRILSRAVCLQLRDQMARVFLASQQFGVGVTCGTEVVVRGVRRALADHPDWVVLQLDVANAFNSFHRDRMFQALQASPEFQCLIPFIGLFYGTPSDLHYRSGTGVVTMHSERGTRQGDPLSPFLYALTQRLALEPVLAEGDVQLWSYADDTYVLGPPDRVLHHFAEIVRRLGEMGLAAQPHKCLVYQTESFLSRDLEAFTGLGIEVARRGLTVTGVPVGTVSFVEQSLPDRLERMGRVLPWLPRLRQPQTAARLLSACVSTRPQYLSRTVPPSPAVISSFTRWDARLGETFQQLLASGTWACREDVREAALDQIFLPIRLGGFGIRRMARIAPVSFVCSWVQCAPILCSLPACGEVFRQSFASGEPEQIDRALQTALEGLPPDVLSLLPPWPSCASASPDSLFAGASRLLEAHALEAVRARHTSPLHLARLTSLQGGGAGAWLTSVPYADPLRIPEALWQAASSSRLGLPIPQLALAGQCSCGQAIDDMTVPHHAVRCPRYGVATTIHDTVKYMLRDFAVEAGFAVKVEDSTLFTQLEAARARLLGQPVVGEGTRAEGPGERRGEAGQPGGGGQWGRHQLRGQVERGTGGQRGRQGEQTGQDGEGGRHRQQQESQWRPRAQGAAPPGSASGAGQGREQQRADGGTGGAAGLGGEGQGVREAAGDGAGGSGGLGEGREGEGRGQVDGGEERGRETIGEGAPRDQTGQQPAQQQGPVGRTGRVGTASRIPDLTCRDVGQGLMVLVDVSIADPQREGNVQLRRATPTQIGVAAARRVQEKLRHWGPHLEGLQPAPHFYACVAETFGLLSEPLRQFLGLCAKRIAQRRRDRGGGDDGSARIFEAGLTTRLSVALQRAQAQCMIQHAVRQLGSHTPCPLMPSAPPAPTLRVPAPLPPLLTLPAPPRRFPPPAIRSSPPVRSPPLPSPPPSPPLLHASSFPSPTHSTPCPSSIRTLPLVSRPPMLGFSPPCPSPPFPAPHLPPLPAPPTPSPPPCPWLPTSLPHLSPLRVLSFSPPCPSLLPALPLIFRPPPPTPGFSPPRASLSFSVPLLCSLPAPACPCPCLWLLPSLPHPLPVAAPPLAPSTPLPPVHPKSHPTAPTLPRLPVSALHPRDRVRLPTAQRCHTPCPLMPSAPPAPTLRVPAPLPPLLTLPAPPRRFPPPAIRSSPPVRSPPLPSPPPSPPLLHASSFPRRPTPLPAPPQSAPCPSYLAPLCLVSPLPAPRRLSPLPTSPLSLPPPLSPPLVLGFLPPCLTFPPSVCSASPLPAPPSSPPCPSFSAPPPPRPVSPLPAPPFLSPCLSFAPSLPPPAHAPVFGFSPPCPTFLPSLPPVCPSLVFPSPIASLLPALDFPHPCPRFLSSMPLVSPLCTPIQPPPPSPGCPFPLSTPATVCGFQPPNGGAHGAFLRMGKPPRGPPTPLGRCLGKKTKRKESDALKSSFLFPACPSPGTCRARGINGYNTRTSREVTQPSTALAHRRLASEF